MPIGTHMEKIKTEPYLQLHVLKIGANWFRVQLCADSTHLEEKGEREKQIQLR